MKFNLPKLPKQKLSGKTKKWLIPTVAAVAAVAIGVGIFAATRNGSGGQV